MTVEGNNVPDIQNSESETTIWVSDPSAVTSQNTQVGTKNRWKQDYTVPGTYATYDEVSKIKNMRVSPDSHPQEVSALEALWSMNNKGVDMRPHIYDKALDQFILLDSGAQISACPPDPGDTPDPTMSLRAANGSKMKCFGTKKLTVRINRKEYSIQAIKTEVKAPILGWNFVKKHKASCSR